MKRRAQSGWWNTRSQRFQEHVATAIRNVAAAVALITEAQALRLIERLARYVKPLVSDTEWNAFPPFVPGRPAAYSALTASGHMQIPQKRILTVERHIAHEPPSVRAVEGVKLLAALAGNGKV